MRRQETVVSSREKAAEQVPRLAALARDDKQEQVLRRETTSIHRFPPQDDRNEVGLGSVEMAVVEAKLNGGALVESPANGTLSGRKWRVLVFEYGLSKNRYPYREQGIGNSEQKRSSPSSASPVSAPNSLLPLLWTERSGRQALRHLEGARCFADHVEGNGGGHSVRDLIGFFSEPALGLRGPEATLTLLESERWAREKLLAAWEAGRAELIGFSVDAVIAVRPVREGAQAALEVEDISSLHSVDMVSAASSGGRALEVLEGRQELEEEQVLRRFAPQDDHALVKEQLVVEQAGGLLAGARGDPAQDGPLAHARGSDQSKGAIMKQEIVRMLEAVRQIDAVSGPAVQEVNAGGTGALQERAHGKLNHEFAVATHRGSDFGAATRELRAVLEAEAARPEVNPGRVMEALTGWLSATEVPGVRSQVSGEEPNSDRQEGLSTVREQVNELRPPASERKAGGVAAAEAAGGPGGEPVLRSKRPG